MFWNYFVSLLAAVGIMGAPAPSYSDSHIPAALQVLDNAAQQLDEHKDNQEHISNLAQSLVLEARSEELGKPEGAPAPTYSDSYIPVALQVLANAAEQLDEHKDYQENISNLAQSLVLEARSQGLGKFDGFSDTLVKELKETSNLTAAEQLKMVLQRILDREDMKRRSTKTAVKEAVKDLEDPETTISKAMALVEPMQYTKK